MNTTTSTEIQSLAKLSAMYIDSLNGASETFIIESDTLSTEIGYTAQTGSEAGD